MISYLLKRLLLFIPTVLAAVFVVYAVMELTPGDPARIILGEGASEAQLAILRRDLALDRPFPVRYAVYVYRLFTRFDLGDSYRWRTAALPDILAKFPRTLTLAFWAVLWSACIGIPLGLLQAARRGSALDTISGAAALGFASIPSFLLGTLLILVFALNCKVLPAGGAGTWRHYILPSAALALPSSAEVMRLCRSITLEFISRDYITTAWAKGAGETRTLVHHAFRNALPPVITALALRFGYLLGGAVITETVFAMPGLGTHLVNAIRAKDTPVALASTVFLSLFFCLIMLLADICCAFLDPRLRERR